MSHGPLIPFPENVSTGCPCEFSTIRHPAFAVADAPPVVGRLPTITQPLRNATSAVVSPTPPTQPGTLLALICAKTDNLLFCPIWTMVVPVPCWLPRSSLLLKLLTSTLFA